MAREEQSREDLLREATGLKMRVEFNMPHAPEVAYVAGFRANGAFSLYCGEDPVYQFNDHGEFRRGFSQGRLIKAECRQLVFMRRERPGGEVQLTRLTTSTEIHDSFMSQMHQQLADVRLAIRTRLATVVGQVPACAPVLEQVLEWLDAHAESIAIAEYPNANRLTSG